MARAAMSDPLRRWVAH